MLANLNQVTIGRLRKNSKGFSLIEVMVAMVIVGTIAIVSARSFVSLKKSELTMREADVCKSYLDSAFKNVDMYGVMPTMMDTSVIPTSQAPITASKYGPIKDAPAASTFPLLADPSHMLVAYQDPSVGLSQLNTPILLGGTIAMLNGLYNAHGSACVAKLNYNGISGIIPTKPAGLSTVNDFTLNMTIQKMDLVTGATNSNCATNLTIVPKGGAAQGFGIDTPVNGYKVAKFAGTTPTSNDLVNNNTGFQVNLATSFTTADGRSHSCSATHSYSYMADFTGVAAPFGGVITASPSPNTSSLQTPAYGPDSVSFSISYMGKPGVVLFCRDISTAGYDPSDNPASNGIDNSHGNPFVTTLVPAPAQGFVPCEMVTMCGKTNMRNGTPTVTWSTPNPSNFTMTATWKNQGINNQTNQVPPWGCTPAIEAVAVDLSGTVSSVTAPIMKNLGGALQDCHGSWSACTPPNPLACGPTGGTQTYTINWPAQYGGSTATCAAANGGVQSCALPACPIVNCIGAWGGCTPTGSPTCGTGSGQQTYAISIPASGGGTNCPATNGQTASCSIGSCPPVIDCVGSWGMCSGTCGAASQTYTITTPAANGGLSCPAASGTTQACVPASCPPTPPTPTPAIACYEEQYGNCSPLDQTTVYPSTCTPHGCGTTYATCTPIYVGDLLAASCASTPVPAPSPAACAWVRTAMATDKRYDNIASHMPGHRAVALLDQLMGRIPQAGACASCPSFTSMPFVPTAGGQLTGPDVLVNATAALAIGSQVLNASCNPAENGTVYPGGTANTCGCSTTPNGTSWTCQCPSATPATGTCPGQILSWTVGGNTCGANFPAQAASSSSATVTAGAPMFGSASFTCNASGNWSATPNAGATCSTSATASNCSWAIAAGGGPTTFGPTCVAIPQDSSNPGYPDPAACTVSAVGTTGACYDGTTRTNYTCSCPSAPNNCCGFCKGAGVGYYEGYYNSGGTCATSDANYPFGYPTDPACNQAESSYASATCPPKATPSSLCAEMCATNSPAKPIAYAASTLGFNCTSANSFPSASSNCSGTYVATTGFKGSCDANYTCADFQSNPVPNCPPGWFYNASSGVCESTSCTTASPGAGAQCCSGSWTSPPTIPTSPGGWTFCGCTNSPVWWPKTDAFGNPIPNGC